MKKTILLLSAITIFTANGCKNVQQTTTAAERKNNDYLEMAILYHQQAAEIKAMYYQSFNLAKLIFEQDVANTSITPKRAVIVDIDETVLDNSPYEAECVLSGIAYPLRWDEWIYKGTSGDLPGAVDFLKYVAEKNAEVFYVTNRTENQREGTLRNLKEKGFPFADNQHLMMKSDNTSKEKYRKKIAETYHISLLIGDNLSDFVAVFDKQLPEAREQRVDSLRNEFGKRFIILPNAMYGDWESALYNYNYKLSEPQKDSIRKANLKGL